MWNYVVLFFLMSPGILPALLRGRAINTASTVPVAAAAVAAGIFGVTLYALQSIELLPELESFQLRGEVGSERSETRKKDKQGNPIRTCAEDYDCGENETRTSCKGGICKEPSA
jgi:hypothetical protein